MATQHPPHRQATVDKVPAFEHLFEQEHVLTERILDAADRIVEQLQALPEGEKIPHDLYQAMAILVYLNDNFADQAHLAAEEAAIPIAIARGMPAKDAAWVYTDHDQGRAYAKSIDIAWQRINSDDETDYPHAIDDYQRNTEGMVKMFRYHAEREDHRLFPEMAKYMSPDDDDLVMHVIRQIGPADVTPYISLVATLEESVGIQPPTATE
jgi:hemerythrin-like domain-containing protein